MQMVSMTTVITLADLLPETFDIDTDEDFFNLEAQFEEFIQSSESEQQHKAAPPLLASNKVQKFGMENVGGTRKLSLVNCLEERGGKFSRAAKYAKKPAKCVNPKCSPRRIQQPR